MYRIPILLAIACVSSACAEEPFQAEFAACRCETEGCAPNDCFIEVTFDAPCSGQLVAAEVWIDGHVEQKQATPGEVLRTCSRIPWRGSSQIAVRGGEWIWGPLTERCDQAGATTTVLLQCVESANP